MGSLKCFLEMQRINPLRGAESAAISDFPPPSEMLVTRDHLGSDFKRTGQLVFRRAGWQCVYTLRPDTNLTFSSRAQRALEVFDTKLACMGKDVMLSDLDEALAEDLLGHSA